MTEPFLFSDRLKGVRNKNERTIQLNPTIERKIHHEKVFCNIISSSKFIDSIMQ